MSKAPSADQRPPRPWTLGVDHVLVSVRLTPKSSRDALEGVETLSDGRCVVKARVRPAPEDGKANEALVDLVAKSLKVSRARIRLASGATSRLKTIRIDGASEDALAALEGLMGEA